MQTGKKAVESVKESAANVAASARSGMEKTRATLQEKGDKMSAHSDVDKHMAEQRKEERIAAAELNKQEAKTQNAAQRAASTVPGGVAGHHAPGGVTGHHGLGGVTTTEQHSYSTTGEPGYTAGPQKMSAMPGHGTGQPAGGNVVEGTVGSHPIGKATGTAAHNTRAGAGLNSGTTGQGTGGAYTS